MRSMTAGRAAIVASSHRRASARRVRRSAAPAATRASAVCTSSVLTGPRMLSYQEVAALIADGTGREVRVVHVDVDRQAAELHAAGIPLRFARILAQADAGLGAGREDSATTAVTDLTGRPARSFAEFVREHAARWAAPAA